jgi:hypothetical protein
MPIAPFFSHRFEVAGGNLLMMSGIVIPIGMLQAANRSPDGGMGQFFVYNYHHMFFLSIGVSQGKIDTGN